MGIDRQGNKPRHQNMAHTTAPCWQLYIIYAVNFNASVSRETFYAILQSNFNESTEFAYDYISPLWFLLVLLASLIIGYLLLRQEEKETTQIENSLLIFLVAVFATFSYSNSEQVRLYSYAKNTINEYLEKLAVFRRVQAKFKNNEFQLESVKNGKGETYIVVIGESLNKRNMGIYGYLRDTTPSLSKY